ncbi:unnamed protein product [Gadus morhua 'NCC']
MGVARVFRISRRGISAPYADDVIIARRGERTHSRQWERLLRGSSRPGGKGSIRCAVVSVGRAWTILLQRFHPGEKRGLALEDIIQEGRNGAKL